MTNQYELVVLLHPDLEIDVETPISKLESLIQAVDGTVLKRDNWGKKRLAYRINKQDFAVYIYFEIEVEAVRVRELENTIQISEEVMRHILVQHEDFSAKAVAPAKGAKDAATAEPTTAAVTTEGN